MKTRKNLPWWLVAAIDILLAGAILCTFSYFHHVRILWGDSDPEQILGKFEKNENNNSDENNIHIIHNWVLLLTEEASCTDEGYMKYTCSCGDEKIENRTPPTGHLNTELHNAKVATEDENGYTGDTYCIDCGQLVYKGSEIPAKKHDNLLLIKEKIPTCSEKGYSGDWFCTDCGEVVAMGNETPLAEHTYIEGVSVKSDCYNEGYTVYTCSQCNAQKKDNYVPRLEHVMGNDGYCTLCNKEMVDKTGDFGASFPMMFIQTDESVTLTSDSEIRAYAEENNIILQDHPDGKFISLYRSHDVFISLLEVNTDLYYKPTDKTYYVQYYIYDVYVRNIDNLFTVTTNSRDYSTEELIKKGEEQSGGIVIATINGDYLGNKNHCLVAERNGQVLRAPDYIESDACVLYYDGTMETVTPDNYSWDKIAAKNPYQIWNFGPALLDENGKAVKEYDDSSYDGHVIDSRNPRSSIGYYEPGHYSFVVVDGRSKDSQGVRMVQLAEIYEELGCVTAYNMDGGDSAQAFFMDTVIRDDEDKRLDGDQQRKLYDIICIGEILKDD